MQATLSRYKVTLKGFDFYPHKWTDGTLHLEAEQRLVKIGHPPADGQPDNRREVLRTVSNQVLDHDSSWIVEASDELHAQAVFQRVMGITRTTRDFTIELVPRSPGKRGKRG